MALVEGGEIIEARILLEGVVGAGARVQAVLKTVGVPAIATDSAQEYLLPKGAPGATQGQSIAIEITREAIPGPEPWKRPLARVAETISVSDAQGEVVAFPSPSDRLGEFGWLELLEEARSGIVGFEGGELRVSLTPAMTLIDVDGRLPPLELAMAGAQAAARAIRRHGVGGSIGVDLPTVAGKAERQAIAEAVDAILVQPFERTSVNGFGFLQIVRPRRHASLFELAGERAAFEARALLRLAAFAPPGAKRLAAHPAVTAVLEQHPDWLDALAAQVGGEISLRADPALPMSGGHAEPA